MTSPFAAPARHSGPLNLLPLVAWLAVLLSAVSGIWVVFDTQAQLRSLAPELGLDGRWQAAISLLTYSHLMAIGAATVLSLLGVALASLWTQTRLREQFQALRHASLQAQAADAWSPAATSLPVDPRADTLRQTAEHVRWTAEQVIAATAGLAHAVESLTTHTIADMSTRAPKSPPRDPEAKPAQPPRLSLAWPPADTRHG